MVIVEIHPSDMPHEGKGFAAQMNAFGILATDSTDIHGFNSRYAAIFFGHESTRKTTKNTERQATDFTN